MLSVDEANFYYVGEIPTESYVPRYPAPSGYYNPFVYKGPLRNTQYAKGPRPAIYRPDSNDPGKLYRVNPCLYNPYGNGRSPCEKGPPASPASANEPRPVNPNPSQWKAPNPLQQYSNYSPAGQYSTPMNTNGYDRALDIDRRELKTLGNDFFSKNHIHTFS